MKRDAILNEKALGLRPVGPTRSVAPAPLYSNIYNTNKRRRWMWAFVTGRIVPVESHLHRCIATQVILINGDGGCGREQ